VNTIDDIAGAALLLARAGFSPALELLCAPAESLDVLCERLKDDVDDGAVLIKARPSAPAPFQVEALPLIEPMFHDRCRQPEWKVGVRRFKKAGTAQRKRRQQQRRGVVR